jgi:hypothetical protein
MPLEEPDELNAQFATLLGYTQDHSSCDGGSAGTL